MIVVGLLSGTSADGIDVAAADLRLDGDTVALAPLGHDTVPFSAELRDLLAAVLPPAEGTAAALCALDTRLGEAVGEAAARIVQRVCDGRADLVVSHGQTVHHWVDGGRCLGTLQVGQPAFVVARTGLPVVSDLRAADVAAGGHGAPLASLFDHLLLADGGGRRVALNLGGIANLTLVAEGRLVTAFDTGPANTLIDAAARLMLRRPYDEGGAVAASGRPSEPLLAALLDEPYYALPAPKSTGRERFDDRYLLDALARSGLATADGEQPSLAPEDLLATVTELTARTVADAIDRAGGADEVIVSGGGVHNTTLLERLRAATGVAVEPIDHLGIPADGKEAYLFALLGFLSVHGLPGAHPSATGARVASVLGSLTPPSARVADPVPAGHVVRRLRVRGA